MNIITANLFLPIYKDKVPTFSSSTGHHPTDVTSAKCPVSLAIGLPGFSVSQM